MDLKEIREKLDNIDYNIANLIAQRMSLMPQVAKYKIENNLEIRQPQREKQILENKKQLAQELGINPDMLSNIFQKLMDDAVRIQENIKNHKKEDNTEIITPINN